MPRVLAEWQHAGRRLRFVRVSERKTALEETRGRDAMGVQCWVPVETLTPGLVLVGLHATYKAGARDERESERDDR